MIDIEVANRSGAEVDADGAVALAREVLAAEGIGEGELGIAFVDAAESRELKRKHLGIDEAADVLSFPVDGREPLPVGLPRQLGDVLVCPDVAGEEWRGALVHGLLHLVGYDHGAGMAAREAEYA